MPKPATPGLLRDFPTSHDLWITDIDMDVIGYAGTSISKNLGYGYVDDTFVLKEKKSKICVNWT